MQAAAREIDAFGYDPRSEDPLLPNAAILRGAEAVDAVAPHECLVSNRHHKYCF